uniref:Uncharacterized protein n=1 Tax=Utricularia reniformis TaxID=192314 RepID=A0A1Y0B230_9LAMI|nr:hypothetical protein AEK19_MT1236 [Utricularia reniformis]ART31448.1 hypothetical protein AEK19_MT1236 [Utricularia reniformis]
MIGQSSQGPNDKSYRFDLGMKSLIPQRKLSLLLVHWTWFEDSLPWIEIKRNPFHRLQHFLY